MAKRPLPTSVSTYCLGFILLGPCLIAGVAFVAFGIYRAIDNRAVMARAIQVPGTITGTVKHTYGRDWRLSTFSRFKFKTLDGRIVSHIDEFPDSYTIGERITVVYDPQNLRAVYIDHLPPWSWKITGICILLGVFFLGVAGGPLVSALVRATRTRLFR